MDMNHQVDKIIHPTIQFSVVDALPGGETGGMVRGLFLTPPGACRSTQPAGVRPVPPGDCRSAKLAGLRPVSPVAAGETDLLRPSNGLVS